MASDHPEIVQNELSLLFCDDALIQQLNFNYRGKDKATDVLSFSAIEQAQDFIQGTHLGDLVISIPTTVRQAKHYRVTVPEELLRLLIHGVLHLFGYDHEKVSKAKAARMRRKERVLYMRYREEI